jgi:hypothetical protein
MNELSKSVMKMLMESRKRELQWKRMREKETMNEETV